LRQITDLRQGRGSLKLTEASGRVETVTESEFVREIDWK